MMLGCGVSATTSTPTRRVALFWRQHSVRPYVEMIDISVDILSINECS